MTAAESCYVRMTLHQNLLVIFRSSWNCTVLFVFNASGSVSSWFNLLQNTIVAMTPKLSKQFLWRAIIHFWLNCYQFSAITQPEKDSVRENKTFSFAIWRRSPLKSQRPLTTDNQSPHQLNPMGITAKYVMFCNVNSGWIHFPTTWFNLRPLHFVIFFENPLENVPELAACRQILCVGGSNNDDLNDFSLEKSQEV